MKYLLFIFLFGLISAFAHAQTGTGTLDATGAATVAGGDENAKIVSYAWSVQGTPPAPVTFSSPNSVKTEVTVTKAGNYTFLLTVKDNLGNIATGTVTATVYDKQVIHLNLTKTHIDIQLK